MNFIPKKGEIIIYEAGPTEEIVDEQGNVKVLTTDYVRVKIGDGENNVNDLPFFGGAVKMVDEESEHSVVPEGTIILVPRTITTSDLEGEAGTEYTRTFYSAKVGDGLSPNYTTYLANLKAGDGWGSVVSVEATAEGHTGANGAPINPTATAERAVAMGKFTEASGFVSTALNYDTHATGSKSMAVNSQNTASGIASFASGHANTASGFASTTSGVYNEASGKYGVVGGEYSKAQGEASVAIGK